MFSGLFKKNVQAVQNLNKATSGNTNSGGITQDKKVVKDDNSSDDEDGDDTPEVLK